MTEINDHKAFWQRSTMEIITYTEGSLADIIQLARKDILSLITTIESQKEEIEKLNAILERLPAKIMQLDSWADTEELTFPLTDPTEDDQLEWFEEFCRKLDDHVQSCFDGELYELVPQEGDK